MDGSGFTLLHSFGAGFGPSDGYSSSGSLVTDGTSLYGMTPTSLSGLGTIFVIGTNGTGYRTLHTFLTDGAGPRGSLVISGGILYGMALTSGTNGFGTIFQIGTDGSGYQVLHGFSGGVNDGANPYGSLIISNSTLYGTTSAGGANNVGVVFRIQANGSGFQILHNFSMTTAWLPMGDLTLSNATLYGMTGGSNSLGSGAIFQVNTDGSGFQIAHAFSYAPQSLTDGSTPYGTLLFLDSRLYGMTQAGGSSHNAGALFSFSSVAVDVTDPTLTVTAPTSGLRVSNYVFNASGTASDNVGVAEVYYQLNNDDWATASTFNGWTNWSADNLNLAPGTNVLKFYASDLSGNVSATNVVSFTVVLSAEVTVNISPVGGGTLKPNLNGEVLQIGKPFSMTAKAAKGFAFVNWTGAVTTNSTKLAFLMAPNMTFTANFKDIARPVNAILSPTKNQTVTNLAPVAVGKAKDNNGVTAVWFRVNGGNWLAANLPDGTNWNTPSLSPYLLSGANTIAAVAHDAAGNASLTNTISFKYAILPAADWAPDSLNGLLASVAATNGSPEAVGFDLSAFAQASTANSTNWEDYGAGSYNYLKIDTNLAQLSLTFTAPPTGSNNVGPIDLVFTNHYAAYFSNESDGNVGSFDLSVPASFVPATVTGKTLTAISGTSGKTVKIKLANAIAFTKTPANDSSSKNSSGNYTFTRFSPVSGMFGFMFTDAADSGQSAYVQISYATATTGTYFLMSFDSLGVLQDVDAGRFTMK
jgi:uncharacterized repeat protein (TIGR03803 family)